MEAVYGLNKTVSHQGSILPLSEDRNNNLPSVGSLYMAEDLEAIENIRITLKRVGLPVVIGIGTIGNTLALVVLHKSSLLRQSSVWYYLKAFFVASLLVLYLGAGLDWVCLMAGWRHLWDVTDSLCRIWQFFSNVVFFSPIWFCVAMVVDRYISICHQRTAEKMCSNFTAKIAIISIQICLIIVSIHAMWTYELLPHGCSISYGRRDFHSIVWPWVSVVVYTFLPLSLLVLFNIALFVGLCSKQKCRNSTENQRTVDNGKLTIATLCVSMTFVVLALPATIMNVYMHHGSWIRIPKVYLELELIMEICQLLVIVNHAIMALVCFCSSVVFRRATYALFLRKTPRSGIELTPDEKYPCKYRPKSGSIPVIHTDSSQL